MDEPANTGYDFRSKYETHDPITLWLIDRFYKGIADLIGCADLCAGATVLEVGCGEGYSTARLTNMLPPQAQLSACDVETRLIEAARKRNPSIAILQQSAYNLELEDNSVDLVVCMEVLEHLDEPNKALRELCRVSRNALLLTVPREPIWCALNVLRGKYLDSWGNTPGHLQHWSSRKFKRFVAQQAQVVEHRSPLPWTQVLARVEKSQL